MEDELYEKKDRCYRIAKRKYDTFPSAYASGAIVKCRQGKIWKDVKEEQEIEEAEKTDFSKEKESGLHGWFARQGGKGKSQGWVDCNTCRKDKKTGRTKCKACGREEGENRKYPACRPTPSACKSKGRGKSWGKKSAMKENKEIRKIIIEEVQKEVFQEGLLYHVQNNIPLNENIYRLGSPCFFNVFKQARKFSKMGLYEIKNHHERFLLEETQIGEWGKFGSVDVPLDFPMDDALHDELLSEALYKGKNVNLGKPQRGGSKKFYVYVKCGDKVKKISFGDPNLSVKVGDPERRKSFVARHKCHQKNDRCSAGYWSCRLPRYPHLIGSKKRYSWW